LSLFWRAEVGGNCCRDDGMSSERKDRVSDDGAILRLTPIWDHEKEKREIKVFIRSFGTLCYIFIALDSIFRIMAPQ
jgi:hypothetical protein